VVITCEPPTLMKGQKWYDVPERTPDITLEVRPRVSAREYLEQGAKSALAARTLTEDLHALYARRLSGAPLPGGAVAPAEAAHR
jgi:hypothetical protein